MLKEKTICSNCSLRTVKTNEVIEVKAPTVTYESTQDKTENGVLETETITINCPTYRQGEGLFGPHSRYIATLNFHHVVGTPRYPLIRSVSTSGQTATVTLKCTHPAI